MYYVLTRTIVSSDIRICLTVEVRKETIILKCKVNRLHFPVSFFNPAKKEEGYCLAPLPFPKCFSIDIHNAISQDRQTNTTILTINRKIGSRDNGPWTCSHGTNRDRAVVNVTVLKEETTETILENDNCREEYMAWTFIGVIIFFFILIISRALLHMLKRTRLATVYNERKHICKRCIFHDGTVKLNIGLTLIIFIMPIPLVIGSLIKNCKDKRYFLIFGFCIVLMLVLCLSIPRKEKSSNSYPRYETDENIPELNGNMRDSD